jgi:16S rRNA (adenine1518-N6/adenine1519-N6)-dimethyltransferase
MQSSRQTQSYLIRRFQEAGLRPDTRHGQNFLIDLNLLELIVQTAALGASDVVLEVGTGLGSLTARMAELAGAVVTVEIDPYLHSLASEEVGDLGNVVMLLQDALRNKNHLHSAVMEAIRQKMAEAPGRQFKLVANLPYNVATPILSNLLLEDPLPTSMTATIQKELADRIHAAPRTKDYSALSIWMQATADIHIIRTMPPEAFWPRPKVTSSIIHIIPNAQKRGRLADPAWFHQFIRGLFLHRRKFLRGVLVSMFKETLGKQAVDDALATFAFSADTRAEQMEIGALIDLAEAFRQRTQVPA